VLKVVADTAGGLDNDSNDEFEGGCGTGIHKNTHNGHGEMGPEEQAVLNG
jgi:hypothetical protein